jgi:hypothetical protein
MASQRWPSRVEVKFTEVSEQITAIIYDRFSGEVLAALEDRLPSAIMCRVRETRELHGSEAVFLRPWPPRMEKFIRRRIINGTRQTLADSGSNIAAGEKLAKAGK